MIVTEYMQDASNPAPSLHFFVLVERGPGDDASPPHCVVTTFTADKGRVCVSKTLARFTTSRQGSHQRRTRQSTATLASTVNPILRVTPCIHHSKVTHLDQGRGLAPRNIHWWNKHAPFELDHVYNFGAIKCREQSERLVLNCHVVSKKEYILWHDAFIQTKFATTNHKAYSQAAFFLFELLDKKQ